MDAVLFSIYEKKIFFFFLSILFIYFFFVRMHDMPITVETEINITHALREGIATIECNISKCMINCKVVFQLAIVES